MAHAGFLVHLRGSGKHVGLVEVVKHAEEDHSLRSCEDSHYSVIANLYEIGNFNVLP